MNRRNRYLLKKEMDVGILSNRIDELEFVMLENFPSVECPIEHLFLEGFYVRQMTAKAGTLITSKIHKYTHEYVVSKGVITVWAKGKKQTIKAPFKGITTAGTRRVGYVRSDVVWTTFHPIPTITGLENDWDEETKLELVDSIEELIIQPHANKLLTSQNHSLCHG